MTLPCLPADAARDLVQRIEIGALRRERLISEIKANIADIDRSVARLRRPASPDSLREARQIRARAVQLLREVESETGGVA